MESNEISKRIDALDYLRGLALMGILLVNVIPSLSVKSPLSGTSDATYWRFLYLFVEGRFYTIFTFLFGVGFYLFISRSMAKGKNGYVLFLRRIVVLFLLGSVHVQFQPGEALSIYAVCGLIILPFYRVDKVVNLVFGMGMLLVISLYAEKIFMVVPLMMLGIAAGQFRLVERMTNHWKVTTIFTGVMFVLSSAGLIYQYQYAPFVFGLSDVSQKTQQFLRIGIMIGPIVSAFYVGMLLVLLNFPVIRRILAPLKSYGRLALTNYVSQTALMLLAGNVFDLFNQLTYIQTLYLCVAIYVIQLIFSTVWLRFFRFGPLEWVWRLLTYLEFPPMRKTPSS
ncbi:DUF418 domain-containing protein [Bacillus sp. UNC41MFS5]|uniref:DUF418 domain-containing protein n=1 Tax=Bacillus sp. UNC41MFS5 TaxID=1449046 RepID=UPI00047A0F67|nr:DUF418 domain-containing protein [Bacillus sp. UNC41MFS5]